MDRHYKFPLNAPQLLDNATSTKIPLNPFFHRNNYMSQPVAVELKLFRQLLVARYVAEESSCFYDSFEGNGLQFKRNTKTWDKIEYF